ncbi:hypothetical protein OIU74_001544 [Salix koriyanagi]|uniref:Uncharacterized protein n=1 Tax=Salix koriyanagi TaxID=2511006 RepID=A0A9Q1ANA8_9ROSI|nr:hypothetical protein OIU74_001544 [Salix koriyanagi]
MMASHRSREKQKFEATQICNLLRIVFDADQEIMEHSYLTVSTLRLSSSDYLLAVSMEVLSLFVATILAVEKQGGIRSTFRIFFAELLPVSDTSVR